MYHIGIIDYLQSWDFPKKAEAFMKTKLLKYDHSQISAIPPDLYCQRFKKFMKEKVFAYKDDRKSYKYLFKYKAFIE